MGGEERTTGRGDCDVGLGLKMQAANDANSSSSSSYPCKRTMVMPNNTQFSPFQHHQNLFAAAADSITPSGGGGGGGGGGGVGGGGGALFCNTSCSDIFDANSLGAGGVMMKGPFTASQWQELERQTMIYNYLLASNNLNPPQQLLLPLTKTPSQSNTTSGFDLRFSSGSSDPEPWRCRRTDGKKWRCSRDVAPDQKYCERHAHKSRPRSRKHVEFQPHTGAAAATSAATTGLSQRKQQHSLILHGDATSQLLQTMPPAATYDQTGNSSMMWFMRGGSDTIPLSTCNQQESQQQMITQSSSSSSSRGLGFNKDNNSVFQQHHYAAGKPESINVNPYFYSSLNDDHDDNSSNMNNTPRRHFIDAWSNEINTNKVGSMGSSRKLPLSSLTLSMPGGNGVDEDKEDGAEMMTSPVSWMNNPPGGPLGEALCLGIATKGASSNLASPHGGGGGGGYSNSSATSSCSKGSCEDGSHQFNFIG